MQTDPKNAPIFEVTPKPVNSEPTEEVSYPSEEVPYVAPPRLSLKERQDQEAEELRRDFTQQLLNLRNPPPIPEYTPPPLNERLKEQTRLEMEAGSKRVSENEKQAEIARAQRAALIAKKKEQEPTTVSVFRPEDYIPNMNQGNVRATTLKG